LIAIARGLGPELDAEVVEADADSWRRDPSDREKLLCVPGQLRKAKASSERTVTHVSHRVADSSTRSGISIEPPLSLVRPPLLLFRESGSG
jgi:hypothetical protein